MLLKFEIIWMRICVVYSYADACKRHNKDERHSSLKNIPLTLFERVVCERELETEQNCNILTPTLLAITEFLSHSPGLLNRGPRLSGYWFSLLHLISNSSDPQLIWSPNWLIGGLRAPFAGCWLCLPQLVSNWSGLQTNWLPGFTELYNSSMPTFFLWASQFCTHSTCPWSRL